MFLVPTDVLKGGGGFSAVAQEYMPEVDRAGRCVGVCPGAWTTWRSPKVTSSQSPQGKPSHNLYKPTRFTLPTFFPLPSSSNNISTRSHTSAMAEKTDAPASIDAATNGPATGSGPKAIIKNVDMSEEMQQGSVDIASSALEKYNIEKDIAAQIKKEFDKQYGPTWHVVVGKNFGSYVTHGEYEPTFHVLSSAFSLL